MAVVLYLARYFISRTLICRRRNRWNATYKVSTCEMKPYEVLT